MEEWVIISKKRIIKRFTISEGQCLTIGRGKEADVIIDNKALSRKQTSLELRGGEYFLADLYSMNGTRVNGKKIVSSTPVGKSDRLTVSKFTLKSADYLSGEEEESKSVAAVHADIDTQSPTLYFSGVYNQSKIRKYNTPADKDRMLTVLKGSGSPAKISLKEKCCTKAGKNPSSDLILSGLMMSTTQFSIVYRTEGYIIVDESGFGKKTMVNGKKLTVPRKLNIMDVIQVGNTKIRFS